MRGIFAATLVHAADKALQVTGFGQGQDSGVIGRGAAGLQQLHAPLGIGGGCSNYVCKLGQRNVMGAGAGYERSAWAEQLHGSEIEFLVPAYCTFVGTFGLGECGGIENDGVELLAGGFVFAQEFECVGFDPVDLRLKGGIEFEITICHDERGAAGIDAGDPLTALGEMEREAPLVRADVECRSVSVSCCGGVVEALVEKGSRLLS